MKTLKKYNVHNDKAMNFLLHIKILFTIKNWLKPHARKYMYIAIKEVDSNTNKI